VLIVSRKLVLPISINAALTSLRLGRLIGPVVDPRLSYLQDRFR